jgi:CheY-like chemotaxis protein
MERADSPSEPWHAPPELRGLSVLIVDDNAGSRRILERTLRRCGASPVTVPDARGAIAVMTQGPPFALLLADATLPDADGLSFVRQAASLSLVGDTRVVVLSPVRDAADDLLCRRLGVAAVLPKPICDRDLIAALSNLVGGASFLPEPTQSAVEESHRAPAGACALVVDDNAVNLRVAVRLLEKYGYRVTAASSGEEALALLDRCRPAIVLMDVQMPGMDGFETTRRIREREGAGPHLPVIALTANAMRGDRERCLAAGMDGYIAKPIDRRELLAEVERLLAPAVVS